MRILIRKLLTLNTSLKFHKVNFNRKFSEHIIPISNHRTLIGRIYSYLNQNHEEVKQEASLVNSSFEKHDEIKALFQGLAGKTNLIKLLQEIDFKCCLQVGKFNTKEALRVLGCFMELQPNRITEFKFYQLIVDRLSYEVEAMSKYELLQFFFYVGLQKKSKTSSDYIKICVKALSKEFINSLTSEELCIICNAIFKTSTRITNNFLLDKVRNYLQDNLYLLKDSALFITLLKTIRQNRYQNEDLLETISCAIFFNKTFTDYNFASMCHILATYSDYLYLNDNLFDLFTSKCLKELQESKFTSKRAHFSEQIRGKDIKRFLWALSNVNYKNLTKTSLEEIVLPEILKRIDLKDLGSFVDMSLFLWMLNFRAKDLLNKIFREENHSKVLLKQVNKERFNLLLTCIFFEDKKLFKELNLKLPKKTDYKRIESQLEKRPELQRVINSLKSISCKQSVNRFEVGLAVPFLNIIGITGYQNNIYKSVHIEILDDYTLVKNSKELLPTGFMSLKLRILDGQEQALIVLESSFVDSLTEKELQTYLLDEIQFVC